MRGDRVKQKGVYGWLGETVRVRGEGLFFPGFCASLLSLVHSLVRATDHDKTAVRCLRSPARGLLLFDAMQHACQVNSVLSLFFSQRALGRSGWSLCAVSGLVHVRWGSRG